MKLVKVMEMKMRSRFSINKVSPFTRSLPGTSTKNERNEVSMHTSIISNAFNGRWDLVLGVQVLQYYSSQHHQFTSEYFEISLRVECSTWSTVLQCYSEYSSTSLYLYCTPVPC